MNTTMKTMLRTAATLAALLAAGAQAHVTLEQPQASAGSTTKAALRVGHGCGGGAATHTITVQIPAGFRGAKPVPKAGWALTVRKAPLAQPYTSHGQTISEDVVEISWAARTPDDWLQDAFYDEFVVRGQVPEQPGALWFKVSQVCDKGRWDWADVPATGTDTKGLKAPAALLQVVPAAPAAGAHQH